MTTAAQSPIAPVTVANDLTFKDLGAVLSAGLKDFMAYPLFGLFFAAFYVVGGLILYYGLTGFGEGWWIVPLLAGFPLLAPLTAVGLYEVSRRREIGEPVRWGPVLGVMFGRNHDQIWMMGALIFVAFAFWMGLAHGVFAIFLGGSGIGLSGGASQIVSSEALMMLAVGGVVGGLFALAMFAITVISLPMLVDREVDFITAIITSLATFRNNKGVMFGWALLIAVALTLAMVPAFLGLFVVLPVLGHATWHLYRRAVRGA